VSSVIIALALLFVPTLILLHSTRRARVLVSAICLGLALVALIVPSGGHNPLPWLMVMACLAIIAAAALCEVVASVRAKVSTSAAHG
jgi:cytochrome b